jgi:hypothetical protein
VDCAAANACIVVGNYILSRSGKSYALRWDGSRWTLLATVNPNDASYTYLAGVSCASPTTCFAIGYFYTSNGTKRLFERWDGTKWTMLPSPQSDAARISCPTTTTCLASPGYVDPYGYAKYERWNGTAWAFVSGPSPRIRNAIFAGIDCVSATSCVTAGSITKLDAHNEVVAVPLILRWDGAKWSTAAAPVPAYTNELTSVSCATAKSCVAVGVTTTPGETQRPFVVRGDGGRWAVVATPNPRAQVRGSCRASGA